MDETIRVAPSDQSPTPIGCELLKSVCRAIPPTLAPGPAKRMARPVFWTGRSK
jgi:hypothetical protein